MIDLYVNSQNSEATRRNYKHDLDAWIKFLDGREPSTNIALAYRSWLELHYAPSSAARMFNTVRAYYKWADLSNPLEKIKSPRTVRNRSPKVPSDKVIAALMRVAKGKRDRLVLALLLNGLRSDEVTRLTVNDWHWVEAYHAYVLHVIGKGNKARRVPATAETIKAVVDYLPMRSTASAWLIQAQGGNRMTTRQVQYTVEKYTGGQLRPHALRHAYATRLVRAGVSLIAVRDLLGHADIQTTQIYTSLDLADIIREAAKDPRNKIGV